VGNVYRMEWAVPPKQFARKMAVIARKSRGLRNAIHDGSWIKIVELD